MLRPKVPEWLCKIISVFILFQTNYKLKIIRIVCSTSIIMNYEALKIYDILWFIILWNSTKMKTYQKAIMSYCIVNFKCHIKIVVSVCCHSSIFSEQFSPPRLMIEITDILDMSLTILAYNHLGVSLACKVPLKRFSLKKVCVWTN